MVSTRLIVAQDRLAEICRRYGVVRVEVMGSFARADEGPESDLDLVVTFRPGAQVGWELVALQAELEALTGRDVDLLTRASIERSPNKYFRRYALRRTELLYEHA
jgi:predicted nucleotidyltransferase